MTFRWNFVPTSGAKGPLDFICGKSICIDTLSYFTYHDLEKVVCIDTLSYFTHTFQKKYVYIYTTIHILILLTMILKRKCIDTLFYFTFHDLEKVVCIDTLSYFTRTFQKKYVYIYTTINEFYSR